MINPDRLTVKSAEALNEAHGRGAPRRQPARLRPASAPCPSRTGRGHRRPDPPEARRRASPRFASRSQREIARYPKQSDAQPTHVARAEPGPRPGRGGGAGARRRVRLDRAPAARARRREGHREPRRCSRRVGATHKALLEALEAVRGSHRVTDQTPENQYQALQRYTRDLTDAARKGKLDPVIGRDEEIRRVMQVLSRRTKNNPGAHRRAGRRQDGDRRGARAAHRERRRARRASRTSASSRSTSAR